jgi:hypothetical protein
MKIGGFIILFFYINTNVNGQSFCTDPEAYVKNLAKKVNKNPETNEIFDIVENPPKYENNLEGIQGYVRKNLTSIITKEKVLVKLIIEKNGNISSVLIDDSSEFSEELKNIFLNMQNWQPASFGNIKVRCRMKIFLSFSAKS